MPQPLRFQDRGKYLGELSQQVWVRCPRCGNSALAIKGKDCTSQLVCHFCTYTCRQNSDRESWFGAVVVSGKQSCHHCGYSLHKSEHREKVPRESVIQLSCPLCHYSTAVPLTWSPSLDKLPCDPYFGLPLWLQMRCCGEVLWAYNAEHLDFLQQYIAASLREQTPHLNRSLVSRLPKWIKSAKHHDEILKCITRLQKMLPSD